MRTGIGSILALLAFLVAGCCPPYCVGRCTSVPTTDAIAPFATLSIEFWDEDGQPQLQAITADTTLQIAPGERFNILYGGTDDIGVRTLVLDFHWTQWAGSTPQRVSPLLQPHTFASACSPRAAADKFRWQGGPRVYSFESGATDFHDNGTRSPRLTVVHGTPPGPIQIP